MSADVLAINTLLTAQSPKTYNDGTPTTFGGSTANTADSGNSSALQLTNKIIRLGASSGASAGRLVAVADVASAAKVLYSTDAGATWTASASTLFTSISGGTVSKCVFVGTNGSQLVVAVLFDGTSPAGPHLQLSTDYGVTFGSAVTASGNYGYSHAHVLWRGAIWYCCSIVAAGVRSMPFNGSAVSTVTSFPSGQGSATAALCVFNDDLMMLTAGTAERVLSRFNGSAFVSVATLVASGATTPTTEQKYGMFVDGSYLYCFSWHSVASGWKVFQVDSSFNVVDVTSAVVPAGSALTTSTSTASRILIVTDAQTAPSSAPTHYVYHSANATAGTTFSVFQWNGSGSAMTSVGSGGSATDAITTHAANGGNCYYTSGQDTIDVANVAGVAGAGYRRYSYVPGSTTGTKTFSVRGWWGLASAEYPATAMHFSAVSQGTITGSGTQIEGVTADGTAKTFDWDVATDGVADGTRVRWFLEAYSVA